MEGKENSVFKLLLSYLLC